MRFQDQVLLEWVKISIRREGRNLNLQILLIFPTRKRRIYAFAMIPKPDTKEPLAAGQDFIDLVYAVSHDLGAPVRHIRQFSSLLLDSLGDELTDEQREFADFVDNSGSRLGIMLQRLLLLSRLYSRQYTPTELDLEEIMVTHFDRLKYNHQSGAQLEYSVTDGALWLLPKEFAEIVLIELLDNALRFSLDVAKPCIKVTLQQNNGVAKITVEDNGVGFYDKFIPRAHKIFSVGTKNRQSAGVGLAIVDHVARLLQGNLSVVSPAVGGAQVTLAYPLS